MSEQSNPSELKFWLHVPLQTTYSEWLNPPNEAMTIERGIEKNIEELCKDFFPMGRESGLGYEIRPGLNVRVNEPIVFFDTQCGGGSGDFLRLLVHMQAAANLDQARAQVEKWLGEKGVKLEATR